eukprot:10987-Heterococcus_DN1.PRE.4
MAATMMLDAMCIDLAAPLDGKRYSMLDLPVSYTKEDLTAVLQRACDREDDAYFQINDIMQEGVQLGTHQRIDYYGIRGSTLIWSFNAPVKVRARVTAPDEEPVEHDLWLRQIERGGVSTVEVNPEDTAGIKWLNDNGCTQSSYSLSCEGRPLTCSKLRSIAYTSCTRAATVIIRACSNIQVLVHGHDGSVRAVRVLSDDTVNTLKNRYNIKHRGKQTSMWAQQHQRFSFGDKQLQDKDCLCDVGITDGDTVKESRGGLLGGFAKQSMAVQPTKGLSESFADISQPGEVIQWCDDAPEWLHCNTGLCLEGVCTNTDCEACSKVVVMNYGFMDFDLLRDNSLHNLELVCPMCDEFVKATSCGMNRCLWRMTGVKAGSNLTISTPWDCVGNYYYSFTEQPSVEWTRLLIQLDVCTMVISSLAVACIRTVFTPDCSSALCVHYYTTTCCIAQIRDPDDVKWAVDDVLSVTSSSSSSSSSTTDVISTDVDSLFDPTWHECALCSEDNTSLMRDVLGWGHAFHGACLFKWWECGERQCPICRFKIQKK